MAIEILKTPQGSPDSGIFNLPPAFDTTKFAAEWVEEGMVEMKKQRQSLIGCNATADGWEVWKAKPKDSVTTVSTSRGKKFVLMCRDRKLQNDVNAMFGNVSKNAIRREIKGETVAGDIQQDPGMLTEQRLRGELRGEAGYTDGQGDTEPNRLSHEEKNLTATEVT